MISTIDLVSEALVQARPLSRPRMADDADPPRRSGATSTWREVALVKISRRVQGTALASAILGARP